MINGISVSGLSEFENETREQAVEGRARYEVKLDWQTGTRAHARAGTMELGPHRLSRRVEWTVDEPRQLLGHNHGPNPQELLLSALGSCMMVAYVVGASTMGIRLDSLSIEVHGEIDLRGFLGLPGVPVPFQGIETTVRVDGEGTQEQFEELHRLAQQHSPNRMTLAEGVPLRSTLVVGSDSE